VIFIRLSFGLPGVYTTSSRRIRDGQQEHADQADTDPLNLVNVATQRQLNDGEPRAGRPRADRSVVGGPMIDARPPRQEA
jgi:hypothetical protein